MVNLLERFGRFIVSAPYYITPLFGLVAGMTGYIAMVRFRIPDN
jgi:hypothetical protein